MKHKSFQIALCTVFLVLSFVTNAATTSLEVADGLFCRDTDSDGLFNNGCGGPNYLASANTLEIEYAWRYRTSLEYDISSVPYAPVSSATLSLYFGIARDLTIPGFPPPTVELLGYVGDGTATSSDMLSGTVLLEFSPNPRSPIEVDVTGFIQDLVAANIRYAGFIFRIKNDYMPGVYSDAPFVGELKPGANDDPAKTPKLIISTTSIPVLIDIKPDDKENTINLASAGVVPVAILSSIDFDASTVDPTSVSLAGASVKLVGKSDKYLCHQDDINLDGLNDLVCQIYTAQFFVEEGETTAILEAETIDGTKLRGEDYIRIVPDNL